MSALAAALSLARRGLRVFPLRPRDKRPLAEGWQRAASSDPLTIHDLFSKHPSANIGVCTDGLIVIDIDAHKGGMNSLPLLGDLPPTFTVRTPRGGLHYYYAAPRDVHAASSVDVVPGIDIRADGGLCAAPGSQTADGAYVIEHDAPICEAPVHIVALASRAKPRTERAAQAPLVELDTQSAISRATHYLQHEAPHGSEGSRAVTAYRVACQLMDYGLSVDACTELMRDHWPCDPPLDDTELEHQCVSAADYRRAPPGIDAPSAGFNVAPIETPCPLSAREWTANTADIAASARVARPWIIDRRAVRQVVSVMISPGGVGKSTLSLQWALAVAGDAQLAERLGVRVKQHGSVAVLNAEDPLLEMQRRLAGIAQHFAIDVDALPHKVRLVSGADESLLMLRAINVKGGPQLVETELAKALADYVRRNRLALLIVDPLVEMHDADENNNTHMRAVVGLFRRVAVEADCAVLLIHHTRKAGVDSAGHAGNADSSRGASAVGNASRIVFTLFGMSKHDAERYAVSDSERHLYVRIDDAKFNLGLASPHATWCRRQSVELISGESMGVLVPAELSEVRADEDRALTMLLAQLLAASPRMTLSALCDALSCDPMLSGMSRQVLAKRVKALLASPLALPGSRRVTMTGGGLSDGVVTVSAVS